jgi:hypothetical protein
MNVPDAALRAALQSRTDTVSVLVRALLELEESEERRHEQVRGERSALLLRLSRAVGSLRSAIARDAETDVVAR